MSRLLLLLLTVLLIAACSSPSASRGRSPTSGTFDRFAPRTVSNDKFPRPITGTFYVSTIPAFYTEPEIIEQPRRRQAESFIILHLESAGLRHTSNMFEADYHVHYDYASQPEALGDGFRHELNMHIGRRGTVGNYLWTAKAWIPYVKSRDIGTSLISLVSMLTSKFPATLYRYEAAS